MKEQHRRLLEFFIVGLGMGMFEDILAVRLVSGEPMDWSKLWLVFVIALPFAFISEWVVDHPKFPYHLWPFKKKKEG